MSTDIRAVGASLQTLSSPSVGAQTDGYVHFASYLRNVPASTSPPAVLAGVAYFAGADPLNGIELWRTDGTPGGTTLLKDLNPGADSSSPDNFVTVGTLVFFNAGYPGLHARALWRTDGTLAGTFPVLFNGTDVKVTTVGNHAIFATPTTPSLVYSSDGTVGGTVSLGQTPTATGCCFASGGFGYFVVNVGGTGLTLWKTDGTLVNTAQVAALGAGFTGGPLTVYNGGLFWQSVSGGTSTLIRIDLTTFAELTLNNAIPTASAFGSFAASNGVYLRAGNDVWFSDGTAANTAKLVTLPQPATANFVDLGGTVLFPAFDSTQAFGLWASNGTAAGTAIVRAFPLGIQDLVSVGTEGYFMADDPVSGRELWKSNGTLAGTMIVSDLVSGIGSSDPGNIFSIAAQTYFFATNASQSQGLWKTDGTAARTALVQTVKVPSGPGSSSALGTLQLNAASLLVTTGHEIDLVTLTAPPLRLASFGNATLSAPFALGNRAIFTVSSVSTLNTVDLWVSDGTIAGTHMLANLAGAFASTSLANPPRMTAEAVIGGTAFFTVTTSVPATVQAWKTDGTTGGTLQLRDYGTTVAVPTVSLQTYGGKFYLAVAAASGNLWMSDGTVVGTVQDLPTYTVSSPLFLFKNKLLFEATVGAAPTQPYLSDGTAGGTSAVFPSMSSLSSEVSALAAAGTDVFYFDNSIDGFIWSSNGTVAGTVDLGVAPGDSGSMFANLLVAAGGANVNFELFVTDGTKNGTHAVPPAQVAGSASQPSDSSQAGVQFFGSSYFYTASVNYSEANPTTLAAQTVAGPPRTLWRPSATFSSTSLMKTPTGQTGYLKSSWSQLGTYLVGVGGDDINPYGEIVYLNSF